MKKAHCVICFKEVDGKLSGTACAASPSPRGGGVGRVFYCPEHYEVREQDDTVEVPEEEPILSEDEAKVKVLRNRRERAVKLPIRTMTKLFLARGAREVDEMPFLDPEMDRLKRPRTRADCAGGIRPCPWVSCRHHTFLDVSEIGTIIFNWPGLEPQELPSHASCSLDIAEGGPRTLEQVGLLFSFSRERARQVLVLIFDKPGVREALQDFDDFSDTSRTDPWDYF